MPISSLEEPAEYFVSHATAPPILVNELINAKVLDLEEIDISEDSFPDANEFTVAEVQFNQFV